MERDNHRFCDTPNCGAVAYLGGEWVALWETISGPDAPDAHLCPRCAEKRAKGVLAEPFFLECARCGRSTRDGETRWYDVPADPNQRSALKGRPPSITVCDACHGADDSFVV